MADKVLNLYDKPGQTALQQMEAMTLAEQNAWDVINVHSGVRAESDAQSVHASPKVRVKRLSGKVEETG